MTERPCSEQSIFVSALDQEAGERAAFLDAACGNDAALRAEVEALLAAHDRLPCIHRPGSETSPTIDEPIAEGPGTTIGPYKLLEQIGEGGMGVVFLAEQCEPVRRKVALKIIKPGMDSKHVIARFEAERQALAMMDHPNIARVLDAGTTGESSRHTPCAVSDGTRSVPTTFGRPYFVMELVRGVPITEHCDENKLTTRERLELFVTVCQAIQHAHQKGIIHRDVKPSSVIVSSHDGIPVVKVIDFGIAKALGESLTEKTLHTGFGQFIGTPLYVSPEQAGMSDLDVDTRSDVYSLGVLLYELLTGTLPFEKERLEKASFDELRRIIREEEPPRMSARISTMGHRAATASEQRKSSPHSLSRLFRGELDWIVMKALEKERSRRYETAAGFAADVQRYLRDEPVLACPPSLTYRLRKFVRRNKTLLATGAAFLLLLGSGIALLARSNVRIRAEQHETETARRNTNVVLGEKKQALHESERRRVELTDALRQSATLALGQGLDLCRQGEATRGLLWQARALSMIPEKSRELEESARCNLRAWGLAAHPLRAVIDFHGPEEEHDWAYSPDGRFLLVKDDDTTARLWDTATGHPVGARLRHDHAIHRPAFCPDGKVCLTVSTKQKGEGKSESWLHLWDAATGKPLHDPIHHPKGIWQSTWQSLATFSPDGRTVAAPTRAAVLLWDVASGRQRGEPLAVRHGVGFLGFSPDGKRLVSVSRDRRGDLTWEIQCWNPATGAPMGPSILSRLDNMRRGLAGSFSPDHRIVLAITKDKVARLYDLTTAQPFGQPIAAQLVERDILFSPDGKTVATFGEAHQPTTVHLWNAATGKTRGSMPHQGELHGWVFSPDSKLLLTSARGERSARLWSAATGKPVGRPLTHRGDVGPIAFSPDSRLVLTGHGNRSARVWQVADSQPLGLHLMHDRALDEVAFSPDGRTFVTRTTQGFGERGEVRLWALSGGVPHDTIEHDFRVLAFGADGKTVLSGPKSTVGDPTRKEARLWDLTTGKPLGPALPHDHVVRGGVISPDGKTVATRYHVNPKTGGQLGIVHLWDARSGKALAPAIVHQANVGDGCLAFSADGKMLATADWTGQAHLWQSATGKLLAGPFQHLEQLGEMVQAIAVSPDGKTLATGGGDRRACIWDIATEKRLAVLSHPDEVTGLAFSADGRWLLTGCEDDRARLWDRSTYKMVGPLLEHRAGAGAVCAAAFTPDSKLVVTASNDIRIWQVGSGQQLGVPVPHDRRFPIRVMTLTTDGETVLTGYHKVSRRIVLLAPLDGSAERINLWVQVTTGMEMDALGAVRPLDNPTWQQRRRRLAELGGPPVR